MYLLKTVISWPVNIIIIVINNVIYKKLFDLKKYNMIY